MKIRLSNAGKRFNREWVFRNLDLEINSGSSLAIIGPNGAGKSTLLQCLGGIIQLSEGSIAYSFDKPIENEKAFEYFSFCGPYLELPEEMTLNEFLKFHYKFKPFLKQVNSQAIIKLLQLEQSSNKQIRNYSSGMKQRVKLAQAIFSDTPVLLLDEPCTNLDASGIELYHSLIQEYCARRTVIVSSNDPVEYEFCGEKVVITDFKKTI